MALNLRHLLLIACGSIFLVAGCAQPETADPPQLSQTWQGNFSPGGSASGEHLKLLDWNIERGLQFESIRETLGAQAPDICILQEVDLNARRTGSRNLAEGLARDLQLNYVFAIEFQELGQGTPSLPAYHGQATLTRLPILSHRVLRFTHQSEFWRPRPYLPNWEMFQPRLGGRIALVTELDWGGERLVVYNVHLESRMTAEGRLRQLRELILDAQRYGAGAPLVVAGDFNARSRPELLTAHLEQEGFRNAVGSPQPTVPPQESMADSLLESLVALLTEAESRGDHRSIDWVFARGPLAFAVGRVHSEVQASDHYPVSVQLAKDP